ncbi:hypothetical protein AWB75_06459 [Caballeronia catudaia]|uniref:Uncharacterized protein n=1 Tax=Caballeronia catudaia TaxID=1777136 RepID=A0A158DBE3_9BURK|nr:hypothetical protein AWB75_06459 [Caballeronia catudaia]
MRSRNLCGVCVVRLVTRASATRLAGICGVQQTAHKKSVPQNGAKPGAACE